VVVLGLLYGGMALGGVYSPQLGIDLRGGTRVTLTAHETAGSKITSGNMNTAVSIMRERVNGLGVGLADIETQGKNHIVISVPGKNTQGALDKIGETAQLTIRQVYETNQPGVGPPATTVADASSTAVTPTPTTPASPAPEVSGGASPSAPATTSPSTTPATTPATSPSAAASSPKALGGDTKPHVQPAAFVRAEASGSPAAAASDAPAATGSAAPSAPPSTTGAETPETTPSAAALAAYASLDCSNPPAVQEDPNTFMVTCGSPGSGSPMYKYLLYPTLIKGKDISSASAQYDSQGGSGWTVLLDFKSGASSTWAKFTAAHVGTLTAVVLDGKVMSAETIMGAITGQTQITGNFSHSDASGLANVLKYGALPLSFTTESVDTISPTLGSTQLKAGLLAGGLGLILVVLYSFFYYRGLSLVTVTSLALSAGVQYPIIVMLGKGIGYTLDLAGIAGLIVAIGVTADSFIVFFERLRDEVREGNTLRSAVEKGWVRARRTIVSADVVSLIAAVILYWLAIGDVQGFAFTLGLSTLVDLFIVFFFTKPLVTLLGRTKFFGNGHPLSGLDPGRLGVDRLKPVATATRRPAPARRV